MLVFFVVARRRGAPEAMRRTVLYVAATITGLAVGLWLFGRARVDTVFEGAYPFSLGSFLRTYLLSLGSGPVFGDVPPEAMNARLDHGGAVRCGSRAAASRKAVGCAAGRPPHVRRVDGRDARDAGAQGNVAVEPLHQPSLGAVPHDGRDRSGPSREQAAGACGVDLRLEPRARSRVRRRSSVRDRDLQAIAVHPEQSSVLGGSGA